MDEREIAHAGDEFKSRVRDQFGFLVADFGFEPAVDESEATTHRLTFRNIPRDQRVEVLNAFHPCDYGFEVDLYRASEPRRVADRNMIYHKLKEDQQPGFGFLGEAADALRTILEARRAA